MSFLGSNLEALYSRHPALRRLGLEGAGEGPLRIQPASCGLPTAQLDGAYLHSRYDPRKEAARLLEAGLGKPPAGAVFLGFGLGYLPEAFAAALPGRRLAVVEREPALFRQALVARDLAGLLALPEASWHIGEEPEEVVMGLDDEVPGTPALLRLRPVYLRGLAYYRKLEALVQSLVDRREVNVNTLRRFGRLWVRNLLSNLELFLRSPGASRLEGLFTGLPALLLAGGPSLDSVLARLPELSERLVLVAVDTSFRLCLPTGVRPDILVTVDPQYWNTRHLDWADLEGTILVSEPSAHPRTFHRPELPPLYFISSFFPIGQLLEGITGPKGRVGAGGSVATTAWDLARLTGASPLYLAGLDLGYPGRRTHARGAFFEETAHALAGRLAPAEQHGFLALTDAGLFPMASASGGVTASDRRMVIYKWWFENQLKQHPGLTRSLSAQGIRIEGLQLCALEPLLELPAIRPQIGARLRDLRSRPAPRSPAGLEARARNALAELAGDLSRLEGLARRGRQLAGRLAPGDRRSAEELNGVDGQILRLASRQVAGFLFQPLIRKILEGGSGTYREAVELSSELYEELADSAGYQAALIRRALQRGGLPKAGEENGRSLG
jgi:hypothetical protein